MKKSLFTLGIAIAALFFTAASCKDPEPEPTGKGNLVLKFNFYNGPDAMAWNSVVSIDSVNQFRMEFFKWYMCNLYAVKADGTKTLLKDVVLADASKNGGTTFTFTIPNGAYDKIEVGMGLDATLNASDPVQFAASHPLSASQAMYWSWATKYRFVRIDAKANETGVLGSADDILVAYHPGADEFYGVVTLTKPFSITEAGTTNFNVKLDMAALFNGPGGTITIPKEPQTHTEPSDYFIADKFMTNWMSAFSTM